MDRLKETRLSNADAFFNGLTLNEVDPNEFIHANRVYDELQCTTIFDYLMHYLQSDVMLLADIFEYFRHTTMSEDGLDPVHYFTLPHLVYDLAFKNIKYSVENLPDVEMYHFFNKAIYGGVTVVNERIVESSHEHGMVYIDYNNLYGDALRQDLPYSGYTWMSESKITELTNNDIFINYVKQELHSVGKSAMVCVSVTYPANIHDKTQDYPLMPCKEVITIEEQSPHMREIHPILFNNKPLSMVKDKLLLSCKDKTNYILSVESLLMYMGMGIELKEFHRGITYNVAPIFREYIDNNSAKRAATNNPFLKDYYKLKNNALYGKTIQSPYKKIRYIIVRTESEKNKYVSRADFIRLDTITESSMWGIYLRKLAIHWNKPAHIGAVVLNRAKESMYKFRYNVLPQICSKAYISASDTDSFFIRLPGMTSDRFYELLGDRLDSSNYPTNHQLYSITRKAALGCFKNECAGDEILSWVFLRPKAYSICVAHADNSQLQTTSKLKGVCRAQVRRLKHEQYKQVVAETLSLTIENRLLRSRNHQIRTTIVQKRGFLAYDNKRYWLNPQQSLPYGHYRIVSSA